MNREDILKMEAGREMDALIAEKVMHDIPGQALGPYPYSTDVAMAWELVEKLEEAMVRKQMDAPADDLYWVCFGTENSDDWTAEATAATAPLAISRAALIAVMEAE